MLFPWQFCAFLNKRSPLLHQLVLQKESLVPSVCRTVVDQGWLQQQGAAGKREWRWVMTSCFLQWQLWLGCRDQRPELIHLLAPKRNSTFGLHVYIYSFIHLFRGKGDIQRHTSGDENFWCFLLVVFNWRVAGLAPLPRPATLGNYLLKHRFGPMLLG